MKWVRSKDGVIFGVCKGIAQTLNLPVGMFRLMWICSMLFFGVGFVLYLMLAISLPREDKSIQALEPWILGVCTKVALRSGLEVGIVRFLAISLAFLSFGATIIGYIVMYFLMDNETPRPVQSSESKPATPPSMM